MSFKSNKTKNREVVFGFLVLLCLQFSAQQNLVQNSSFEDTVQCPWTGGQINLAKFWVDPLAGLGSSEYYNSCSQWTSVPNNGGGFQYARTGNAYSAIFNYQNISVGYDASEYIQTTLTNALLSNKTYCVKFYVSYAQVFGLSCSSIGGYFSTNPISRSDSAILRYNPQINNPTNNFITDTVNWIPIEGTFFAGGGEKYITIGNFYALADTMRTNYGIQDASYFYIDDVSVVEVSPADAGNDTTYCTLDSARIGGTPTFAADYIWTKISGNAFIDSNNIARPKIWANSSGTSTFVMQKTQCSVVTYDTVNISFNCVGMEDHDNYRDDELFSVYPNPANDEIIIQVKKVKGNYSVSIADFLGREVKNISFSDEEKSLIKTTELQSGVYFLNVILSSSKKISVKKIIIQH